jgi:hypothetical protein
MASENGCSRAKAEHGSRWKVKVQVTLRDNALTAVTNASKQKFLSTTTRCNVYLHGAAR